MTYPTHRKYPRTLDEAFPRPPGLFMGIDRPDPHAPIAWRWVAAGLILVLMLMGGAWFLLKL